MGEQARVAALEQRVAALEEQLAKLSQPSVWRVRGLVVEDSEGRSRIILGAPAPTPSDRKRQDPATALVFLDESGADRLVVGFVPGPQMEGIVKERISPAVGIAFNDALGNERGGLGVFENGNVGLGLDYANGREATTLFVMPEQGMAGISVTDDKGEDRLALVWNSKTESALVQMPGKEG